MNHKKNLNKNYYKLFKENWMLFAVVIIFLIFKIYMLLNFFEIGFDASVYMGQAKYIYSFGKIGYFEPLRPLVLPLILGLGWLLGFNISIFGKIIALLFSVGLIFLVYIICLRFKDKIAAKLSIIILCLTHVFFYHSDKILTGIPSTFFALLSFYFFMKKNFKLTGLFAAIAFMTRFPQGILLGAYLLVFVFQGFRTKRYKLYMQNFIKFFVPFFFFVFVYLIFNLFKYSSADHWYESMFWPFMHGNYTITNAFIWMYQGTYFFYFVNLFKENYFFIFALVYLAFFLYDKRLKNPNYDFLLFAPILFLIYFTNLVHKELRFTLVLIPYISIMSAMAISRLYRHIHHKREWRFFSMMLFIVVIYLFIIPKIKLTDYLEPTGVNVCNFIDTKNVSNMIITTTPYILHCLDKKFEVNLHSIPLLINMTNENPESVLVYAPATFPCQVNDSFCHNEKSDAFNHFKEIYESAYLDNQTYYPIYVFIPS